MIVHVLLDLRRKIRAKSERDLKSVGESQVKKRRKRERKRGRERECKG